MQIYLESQEVNLLARSATLLPDRLLIGLLAHTGSCISEALGLIGGDIHFDSSALKIQHLKTRVTITCPGCNARLSRSSVYCPGCGDEMSTALVTQREQHRLYTIPIDLHTLTLFEEYIKRGGAVEKEGKNTFSPSTAIEPGKSLCNARLEPDRRRFSTLSPASFTTSVPIGCGRVLRLMP